MFSEFKDRFQYILEKCDCNKSTAAAKLNVSPAFISQMCSGARVPSDRTISDICREFNVNEIWLRTGDGEPFQKVTIEEELGQILGNVLAGDPSSRSRLIRAFARLPEDAYPWIEKIIVDMARELKAKEEAE